MSCDRDDELKSTTLEEMSVLAVWRENILSVLLRCGGERNRGIVKVLKEFSYNSQTGKEQRWYLNTYVPDCVVLYATIIQNY